MKDEIHFYGAIMKEFIIIILSFYLFFLNEKTDLVSTISLCENKFTKLLNFLFKIKGFMHTVEIHRF